MITQKRANRIIKEASERLGISIYHQYLNCNHIDCGKCVEKLLELEKGNNKYYKCREKDDIDKLYDAIIIYENKNKS